MDVFAALGYEPNCLPRLEVKRALCGECDDDGKIGKSRCMHRLVDSSRLPEPCGRCPQELFHQATEYDVLYGGAAGGGKGGRCPDRAAPSYDASVETTVLTPKGFKLIGDVAVGDAVCNPDGTTARVIGVYDNGPKQFYRVTLADGSTVEADEDHLWAVSIAGTRKRRKHEAGTIPEGLRPEDEWNLRVQSRSRIVNTVELRELVLRAADEKARGLRPHYVQIPLTNPVTMTGARGRWPVLSPYILGALVGDGSLHRHAVSLSGVDPEVFDRVRAELPEHLHLVRRTDPRCPVYGIVRRDGEGETATALLDRDGLVDTHSWDKAVPKRLFTAPVEDRFAFVQGVMDTDGHMDSRGHVELTTVSHELATGMQAMLRSLGYRATMTAKATTYEYKGEKLDGRPAWRLYVQGRHMDRLFHLARKRERVAQFNGGDVEPWHRIVSVEPSGVDQSRCIQVDNLNHLYVTDDYIVTHNTYALVAEGIKCCIRYPGMRVGLFRKSYPEIEDSILPVLAEFSFAAALGGAYDSVKHNLRFPNGSVLMLRFAENIQDASKRLGAEYQLLLFDEVTRTPPEVVAFLQSRLRSGRAEIPVLGVRAASNPGGPGHGAVKAHYVAEDATNYGERVYRDARGRTVRFIPAKVTDNPQLNADYITDLNVLDEATRAAYRDGSWESFEGKVFTEFSRERHVVPRVELPSSWLRYGGFDWGWTAPSAYLLGARDEDGRLWLYAELTMTQTPEAESARRVLAIEGDVAPVMRSADTAMWGQNSSARPIAHTFAEEGCPLRPADKDRMGGKQRMHTYLGDGPACRYHRELGWASCPRLHILDGTCPELVRTLPNLNYDLKRTEDVDTTGEDHHYDACLVAGTLIATRRGEVPIEAVRVGDEVMTRQGWRRVRDARRTGVDQPVLTVTTSDGRTLTGTGNHPVYVVGRGFARLDALRYHDTLVTWDASRLSSSQVPGSGATRTRTGSLTPDTSPRESATASAVCSDSTRRSGKPTTGARSLLGTTCTTPTTTSTTTSLATSCSSRRSSTRRITTSRPVAAMTRTWRRSVRRLLSGTAATRAGSGTASTAPLPGRAASTARSSASGAVSLSRLVMAAMRPGSAPTSTGPMPARPAGSTTRTALARAAERRSGSTGTARPATAHASVHGLSASGTADVYNLSVDDAEEYFAGGVLVHNCRYLLMGIGTTARLVDVYSSGDGTAPVEDFSLVNPIRPANEPVIDPAALHEEHGPIGAPQGAFSVNGEAPPTDAPWVGGVRAPWL